MIDEKYTLPEFWLGLSEVGALETGLADFADAMISLGKLNDEASDKLDSLYVAWEQIETSGSMKFLKKKESTDDLSETT